MKKSLNVLLIFSVLTLAVILALPAFATGQGDSAPHMVCVSGTGSDDSGDGSESSPYQTLEKALDQVDNEGTVRILDKIALTTGFNWKAHGKAVTVTGGVLDLSAWGANGHLNIRDDVTFTNIELTFKTIDWNGDKDDSVAAKSGSGYQRTYVYANGHHLVIAPDVKFTYGYNTNVWLFGGTKGGTVDGDTNLEVYAGTYTYLFGGGNGGTVKGDTHLTVGGKVNPTAYPDNHKSNYNIYGGGWNDTITGSTYLTVQDSARAIYARGGSYAGSSKIGGYINTTFAGGALMDLSGGNGNVNTGRGANLTMTGGTVQQVFGGCTGAAFGSSSAPVTVNLRILGGTVTRRIYGGCYNDYDKVSGSYTYKTSYYVYGNIILTMDANADVKFSGSYADKGIFACSRYGKARTGEHTRIIYTSDAAYSEFKDKLGIKDIKASLVGLMKNVSPTDETHICTYTANGNTITETCSYSGCKHTASAEVKLDPAVPLVYTGRAIEPVMIEYGNGWKSGDSFTFAYSDNVNAGVATVTVFDYLGNALVSQSFTIEKAGASALGKIDETVRGKADGRITGLTAIMEYSTDGTEYTAVTDPNMTFAAGTYYIRCPGDANHEAWDAIALTIGAGSPLKVTFRATDSPDIVKEVSWDVTLTDIPAVPERAGYTDTAPRWNVTDFTHIKKDMTVTAIYKKNAPAVTGSDPDTTDAPDMTETDAPDEKALGGCKLAFGIETMGWLALMIFSAPLFCRKREE